jgi:hypothetical protein
MKNFSRVISFAIAVLWIVGISSQAIPGDKKINKKVVTATAVKAFVTDSRNAVTRERKLL